MVFTYSNWERFCRALSEQGVHSIPACEVTPDMDRYLVLKHDIEDAVPRAYRLAEIEHKYGHRGSYYAHAFLLDDAEDLRLLRGMREMGHEISYHHDVMDSSGGKLDAAIAAFETNRARFAALGFPVQTVCQHGNPIVERVGYSSNRDFFRSERVRRLYPEISDLMVDFKEKHRTDYSYYSDAGRRFQRIYDPINNDLVNSDDKNVPYENLDALLAALDGRAIVSTHPHRWTASAAAYRAKEKTFRLVRAAARTMARVPTLRKLMGRYYYLAKKL